MTGPSAEQVLQVLQVLYTPGGDGSSKKEANVWLDNFQKTASAWTIGDQLLQTESLPLEYRLFAAQTIRQKIEYDFHQLDNTARTSLRDSLLVVCHKYQAGPRPMTVQLSLSMADLAIQMTDWEDPVRHLIDLFGKEAGMIGVLLEFLSVLPEECSFNKRIQMEEDLLINRADKVLHENADNVLKLLLFYVSQPGVTIEIQEQILNCLYSWIRAGDITLASLGPTPVIGLAFDALDHPQLFDVAVDLVCEMLYRSGKNLTQVDVIQAIYPRLMPLRAKLDANRDDIEMFRGYCRIFADAGEAWTSLIVANYDAFEHVVGGLVQCVACEELDIAKITFAFWEQLGNDLNQVSNKNAREKFMVVYKQLLDIIIRHLHYPADINDSTAEERDEFREFRHVMGDVLKQCVRVLGEQEALSHPYFLLQALCTNAAGTFDKAVSWQRVEAPLFSLRAMCREISLTESNVIPQVMQMLPQLPDHPKVKYAAILVIGRYAEWTARHPEFISYQITFVSKGFEDDESVAAAAQAMKHLCKACGPLLVVFLPQLHQFYFNTVKKMKREETYDLTEAMAHVIAAVPVEQSLSTMQLFCHPIAHGLNEIANNDATSARDPSVEIVKETIGLLDQLGTLLKIVKPAADANANIPYPAAELVQEIWPVLDKLMDKFGHIRGIADAFARVCSYAMMSYRWHLLSTLSAMMTRTVSLFEKSGYPCYLWVAWRCVRVYGNDENEEGKTLFGIVQNLTATTFKLIQTNATRLENIPDVIEEFFRLVTELLEQCPTLFCQSPLLPSWFDCALSCLSIQQSEALFAVVTFLNTLFKTASPTSRGSIPQLVIDPLTQTIDRMMDDTVQRLFNGLLFTFPRNRELFKDAAVVLLYAKEINSERLITSVKAYIQHFPESQLTAKERDAFITRISSINHDTDGQKRLASVLSDFSAMFRRRNLITERTKQQR
ncbi:armadillo-type protein [Phlyctochytrium arcticum]|nr:armadillo-type protein [Phlyctochytrium arcticum]